jgi:LAO/AO transport system kinase
MATRGQMGGLSPSIFEALVVLDSAGYEIVIVETVGVGQDEVDIVKTADVSLVVLVPGMGDDIQTIKAGIMEIGDILVINKADREGVLRAEQELQAWLALGTRPDGWEPPIIQTVATHGTGIHELLAAVEEYHEFLGNTDHHGGRRLKLFQNRLLKMLRDRLTQDILEKVPESKMRSLAKQMMNRQKDPYTIVKGLLSEVCSGEEGHD